MDYPSVIG